MNIFVLNSGRCGSTTWIKACQHISNYTAAHESRIHCIGEKRLAYPPDHIEADNRLSWFLGRLDQQYGDEAFYIHLTREWNSTAHSFAKREKFGIMKAYREGILLGEEEKYAALELAYDYLTTVESNISLFLKDKRNKMDFSLETANVDFQKFWQRIEARGDMERALLEFDVRYNKS